MFVFVFITHHPSNHRRQLGFRRIVYCYVHLINLTLKLTCWMKCIFVMCARVCCELHRCIGNYFVGQQTQVRLYVQCFSFSRSALWTRMLLVFTTSIWPHLSSLGKSLSKDTRHQLWGYTGLISDSIACSRSKHLLAVATLCVVLDCYLATSLLL